jgi:NDP-sugar pyrophosphorylase family protein
VLRYLQPGERLDVPDLVLRLLAAREKVCAYPSECLWLDIGRPADYARAQEVVLHRKGGFDLDLM